MSEVEVDIELVEVDEMITVSLLESDALVFTETMFESDDILLELFIVFIPK